MPSLNKVGSKIRYSVDRLDGGMNTKDAPSRIPSQDSPDCLNVVFDRRGAVVTRPGSAKWNTQLVGSYPILGAISYNNEMVIWHNGLMMKTSGISGTTFNIVTTASGLFSDTAPVASVIYQNVLFCSDGTNAWKYSGGENFSKHGIEIASAPTGTVTAALTSAAQPGTYYYGVAYVNSQAVEGEISSASTGTTLTVTGSISLTIPVGSTLAGVNERWIYRSESASGPFRRVGVVANNTAVVFTDTTPTGQEGKLAVLDGTEPTPYTTIALHKERLFFVDPDEPSMLRWTNYTNPYVSEVENFEPIDNGDGETIQAIVNQDDVLTVFKNNKGFGILTTDPSDAMTWKKVEHPTNLGIVGPFAFARVSNGVVFIGRRNNRITGAHFLSGIQVLEMTDGRLRTLTISEKIEQDILDGFNRNYLNKTTCGVYNNRLYISYVYTGSSYNDSIWWMDLNRIGSEGQPGSWAPWSGINAGGFFNHNGDWFSYDSSPTGYVRQLELEGTYNDSGAAINSYFWTKEVGGNVDDPSEGPIEAYVKDLRDVYIWYAKLGDFYMNVAVRADGDSGSGNGFEVNLDSGENEWGVMVWGVDDWGGERYNFQTRVPIGRMIGRRFQLRFDNQNQVDQAFKVNRVEMDFNLRRRR